ncbi:MAG: hypothetical protein K6U74_11420 [Firmicutes bacterium]|nr:hypothetical protein [Bacillota bacterium]
MGVIAHKVPGRRIGTIQRLADMYLKAVQVFMDFADVGFRYIDIPTDDEFNRPKKKR